MKFPNAESPSGIEDNFTADVFPESYSRVAVEGIQALPRQESWIVVVGLVRAMPVDTRTAPAASLTTNIT